MRIEVACFTERGGMLGRRLADGLAAAHSVGVARCGEGGASLREWTRRAFSVSDALVFIGAAGIAVRAVAPHLASKTRDPAVVVVDDTGRFAVSLLSGHIGGANALAVRIAAVIGAEPVITTATDRNGVFAFDAWAAARGMAIVNAGAIRRVSAGLLAGETIRLRCDFALAGELPGGCVLSGDNPDVIIGLRKPGAPDALALVPPVATLGIGCRRGVAAEIVEAVFAEMCESSGVFPEAIGQVCSIDLKRDEPGIVTFCRGRELPFVTFDAARLGEISGEFAASEFVERITGVDNVCERAAVTGSGGGRLIVPKIADRGVTMAVAVGDYTVDFGGDGGEFS